MVATAPEVVIGCRKYLMEQSPSYLSYKICLPYFTFPTTKNYELKNFLITFEQMVHLQHGFFGFQRKLMFRNHPFCRQKLVSAVVKHTTNWNLNYSIKTWLQISNERSTNENPRMFQHENVI